MTAVTRHCTQELCERIANASSVLVGLLPKKAVRSKEAQSALLDLAEVALILRESKKRVVTVPIPKEILDATNDDVSQKLDRVAREH